MTKLLGRKWPRSHFAIIAPLTIVALLASGLVTAYLFGHSQDPAALRYPLFGTLSIHAITLALLIRYAALHLRQLEDLSLRDTLTDLPNRRGLHRAFERDASPREEAAIALIDLDGCMLVNDTYGHDIGDQSIRECARLIGEIAGDEAMVCRLGGDEFALFKSGPLSATLLEGISRRIVDRLSRPISLDERRLMLGASIGLARSDADAPLDSSELLRRADVAMYASKRGGKARCTWFTEEFDKTRQQHRELDDELRGALAHGEFELLYQPLVDCSTRKIVSVESLIRWRRPDGRPIGPNVFIPVAEQSGLINPIGLWVLRQACMDALAWDDITLSVNISAAQLRNPEFPIQLGHVLEETGFAPERLELEITETCLVLDPVVAERSLAVIRDFGVNVVLDDFGTGYASIGFLRRFRFEKLKLDRSLVVQAGEDDGSRAMMLSSITVARAMQMGVTAEGVETEAQADMVRAAGCDQIQGWLYFKAMPASEIAQHLGRPIGAAIEHDPHELRQHRGISPA